MLENLLKLKNALDNENFKLVNAGTITNGIVPLFPLWGNMRLQMKNTMFENEKVKKIFSWVFSMALTLALAALTAVFLFQSVMMQESSMEPTISVGDKFLINKIVYKIQEPKRGDIIVFKTNASEDAALHIRRVIGVPGDTVQIKEGRIWINGEIYNEGMDLPKMTNAGLAENAISLQSEEYFVLGDNRNNSEDSRYGDIGLVEEKFITGKIWFKISPVKEIGILEG